MTVRPRPGSVRRDARTRAWLVVIGVAHAACADAPPAPASASVAPETTTSASVAPAPVGPDPAPPSEPVGSGFTAALKGSEAASKCNADSFEVAQYLQRGELTLAGRPAPGSTGDENRPQFAAAWLVKLPSGRWQIGFAGYDHLARRVARDRGIALAREHAPKLFATGDHWTVVWFDDDGLAYARPTFDTSQKPSVEHLTAAKSIDPKEVALNDTPDGSLIVASHIGTAGDQLSVFLFAPVGEGQAARAIGLTKAAVKPTDPGVVADGDGYIVAWREADDRIVANRIDQRGDPQGRGFTIVGAGPTREKVELTRVKGGALVSWVEGDRILVRKLDSTAKPAGDVYVVGTGKHPTLISTGDEAIAAFLSKVEEAPDQLVAVRIADTGAVSSSAVRISDGQKPVLDAPAIALGGKRLAAVWTEVMSPTISSKRAWLRIVDASCLP